MNYFEKKQWIRLAVCAVVLLAVSLFLTGVIGGKNLVYKMPDGTETKEALAEGGADYAWKSEQETDFSTIRVEMNAADGKITDCRITSEAKEGSQDFMDDAIREAWAKSIVENGTAENDVISGATIKFSADAVKKAVNELLPEMGIEAPAKAEAEAATEPEPAAEPTPEPAAEPAAETGYAWKSEQETDYSTIRVEMNAADGKITDCRITSEAKAGSVDFMNDAIREAWAKSIVENGTAENDVISGATIKFSADAVKKAVNELLPEMGIEVPAKDEPAPEAAPETPAEAPAAEDAPAQAGGQTVTKETPFSFIHVTLDIRDGKIADCQITSEAKEGSADFLNDAIRESWAKAIVENGTAETDVITGATITASSAAVIEAVKEITGK